MVFLRTTDTTVSAASVKRDGQVSTATKQFATQLAYMELVFNQTFVFVMRDGKVLFAKLVFVLFASMGCVLHRNSASVFTVTKEPVATFQSVCRHVTVVSLFFQTSVNVMKVTRAEYVTSPSVSTAVDLMDTALRLILVNVILAGKVVTPLLSVTLSILYFKILIV